MRYVVTVRKTPYNGIDRVNLETLDDVRKYLASNNFEATVFDNERWDHPILARRFMIGGPLHWAEVWNGKFYIDSVEGGTFRGYTRGGHWNGWAMPLFTKTTVERIAKAFNVDLDWQGEQLRYRNNEDEEWSSSDPEFFKELGLTLYDLGSGFWTWDDAFEDLDPEQAQQTVLAMNPAFDVLRELPFEELQSLAFEASKNPKGFLSYLDSLHETSKEATLSNQLAEEVEFHYPAIQSLYNGFSAVMDNDILQLSKQWLDAADKLLNKEETK